MAHFDLSLYETVAQRLVRWWTEYPDGRIITSIHHYDGSTIIMRAECYNNDDRLIATGYAEEVFGNSPVNKTSFLENCETSAIGRAISNSRIGHTGERACRCSISARCLSIYGCLALSYGFALVDVGLARLFVLFRTRSEQVQA